MTTYVILGATNEPGTIFAIVAEETASSPERAIRKYAATVSNETAVYAAVPKRSWKPVRVEVEVRETVKVTPL